MSDRLFDTGLLRLRRERADRMGRETFLLERAFGDAVERLAMTGRRFPLAVLYGEALPGWSKRLTDVGADEVRIVAPGSADLLPAADLCVSIGALDTAEPLPATLAALRFALAPDALFIGAFVGGDSLPSLRAAMRSADEIVGGAAPHVHPRIDAPSFAGLLADAQFLMPVVDVDRVRLNYSTLDDLVRDLRAMGATNRLQARPRRPILRTAREAARRAFAAQGIAGRTSEMIELLHFAAWTPGDVAEMN